MDFTIETKCPCKHCEERHTACHDKCKKYKAWRHELDKIRANESKAKQSTEFEYIGTGKNRWRHK